MSFLNEKTKHSDLSMRTSELYEHFKNWFVTNNPKQNIPTNREFTMSIRKYKKIDKIKFNNIVANGIRNIDIIDEL